MTIEELEAWQEEFEQFHARCDATPSNFLFGQGLGVIGIDLERMKRADRVFDVGRLTGELQHFFLQHTGNNYAAEPFSGMPQGDLKVMFVSVRPCAQRKAARSQT